MYLTEMIKVLPTQPGRYLAAAAALSHVLQHQQRRPKIQHWLQEKKHSSANRDASAKLSKGAQPLLLPASLRICVPNHERAGTQAAGWRVHWYRDAGETEGSQTLIPHLPQPALPRCTHSPGPRFQGPENHWSSLTLLLLIPKRRQGTLSSSWPHETASSPRRGFQGSSGPSTG